MECKYIVLALCWQSKISTYFNLSLQIQEQKDEAFTDYGILCFVGTTMELCGTSNFSLFSTLFIFVIVVSFILYLAFVCCWKVAVICLPIVLLRLVLFLFLAIALSLVMYGTRSCYNTNVFISSITFAIFDGQSWTSCKKKGDTTYSRLYSPFFQFISDTRKEARNILTKALFSRNIRKK